MNLLLSFGDWFAQNWIILVLIVLAIAMLVPSYLRQRKEMSARNELNNSIKKGAKIITTAGVYGTVESIEETTDGKVVTIVTGSQKNATTMTIHINAIGGIDNKKPVSADTNTEENEEKVEVKEESVEDSTKEVAKPKKTTSKSTKKSSKK